MMVFLKCLIQNKPEKNILDVEYFYHYCSDLAIKGFLEYMVLATLQRLASSFSLIGSVLATKMSSVRHLLDNKDQLHGEMKATELQILYNELELLIKIH